MPRLDNGNDEVIRSFGVDFDEDDPGNNAPIDLCGTCFAEEGWIGFDTDHPPYDDGGYTCFICGATLTWEDD